MRTTSLVFPLCLFILQFAIGQVGPTEITNSDVISMTKAGIGEPTILLAIQRGPVKFDTSPQALIALKTSGVSDQILNAILAGVNDKGQVSAEAQSAATQALFQRALNAIGPLEKVMAIRSFRLKADFTVINQGKSRSFEREEVRVFPDRDYSTTHEASGPVQTRVITSEFNYGSRGGLITAISAADLETAREQFEFAVINIAQRPSDYVVSSLGDQAADSAEVGKLKIAKSGKEVIWEVDSETGRIRSTRLESPKGIVAVDLSDYRLVQGIYVPFKSHMSEFGSTVDLAVSEYEINPAFDEKLFERPIQTPTEGFTLSLKVLQQQSVPYTQESGGGISSSCNIVGIANTSAYTNTVGNSTFGNATTNSNQRMSCNSYDSTIRWPHVLNVMFAEGSDGNSYMFACDRAWRWSKCVSLQVGQVFNARFTNKGLQVEAFNTKGKEENPTYHILQSKSLR